MKSTGIVLGVAALLGVGLVAGDASADAKSLFQRIKDKEDLLGPVPPETSHLVLGSIDCDTATFTLASFPYTTEDLGYGNGVLAHTTRYEIGAFAKHVHMQVNATNRKGRPLSLTVFGKSASESSTDHVDVDIGESTGTFSFLVKCGDKTSTGPKLWNDGKPYNQVGGGQAMYVNIYDHSHYWADGGAFVVEAFPVAVLYEPPADHQKKSFAEYLDKTTIGSSATFKYSSSNSTTQPATPPMNDTNQAAAGAKAAGAGLIATGNPYAMAAGAVLEVISTGLGSTTATTQTGSTTLTSEGLRTRMSASTELITGTGASLLGPGDGDYIWYHHNAYFAWEAENDSVHAVFLGSDVLEAHQVADLKADLSGLLVAGAIPVAGAAPRYGTRTHLTAATIQSLLKLDPFASLSAATDPSPSLPASRFYDVTQRVTGGADHIGAVNWEKTLSVEQAYTSGDTSTSFTTNTTQYSTGWLSFLGIGITEDKTLTATVGLSRTHDSYDVNRQAVTVHLFADSQDHACTKIYFDKLFSTFAFKPARCN